MKYYQEKNIEMINELMKEISMKLHNTFDDSKRPVAYWEVLHKIETILDEKESRE